MVASIIYGTPDNMQKIVQQVSHSCESLSIYSAPTRMIDRLS